MYTVYVHYICILFVYSMYTVYVYYISIHSCPFSLQLSFSDTCMNALREIENNAVRVRCWDNLLKLKSQSWSELAHSGICLVILLVVADGCQCLSMEIEIAVVVTVGSQRRLQQSYCSLWPMGFHAVSLL